MNKEIQVIKLGGSILTDKQANRPVFCHKNALRIAGEIAALSRFPVMVHGTGSFGKPPARKYGYLDGFISRRQSHIVSIVSQVLETLRSCVLETFRQAGIPAVSLSAGSLFRMQDGVIVDCHWTPVMGFLERGMMPVISGDFVLDSRRDFAACSSDLMASQIAISLKATRLIFATDVTNILGAVEDSDGALSIISEENEEIWRAVSVQDGDVSKGMYGKLRAGFQAAKSGIETLIMDGRVPGRVFDILSNKPTIVTRLLPTTTRCGYRKGLCAK